VVLFLGWSLTTLTVDVSDLDAVADIAALSQDMDDPAIVVP
jgi:hypothetical protein